MSHSYDVRSSREIYSGAIVGLRVDTVAMPGGDEAEREVVTHPGAVAVVALVDGDGGSTDSDDAAPAPRVVFIRQYRPAIGKRLWELPAGLLDVEGEEPEAAARRELHEETGYEAERLEPLVELYPSPGFSNEHVRVFLATGLTGSERPEGEHEEAEIDLELVALPEAVEMVHDGRVVNGIAVAALLAAATRR